MSLSFVDRYTSEVAVRRSRNGKDNRIDVRVLVDLEIKHLPRHQEIVRVLYSTISRIAAQDPEESFEQSAELINDALNAIAKVEELSYDGLISIGIDPLNPNRGIGANKNHDPHDDEDFDE